MKKIANINKRYKKGKNYQYLILSILFCCLLFLTIGWSAFLQKLYVNDLSVRVNAKKDIRVTSVVSNGITNGGIILSQDYDHNKVFADITLPNESSTVSFIVEIINYGNVDMGILKIDNLPDNLEMVIDDYKLKDKICGVDRCNLGIKKEIKITIKYKENGFRSDKDTYNLNLNIDFREFHKITYSGFNINISKYPKEIMDGDTLKVTLDNSINRNNLNVYVGNIKVTDFTLESNVLQIENVTGDVIIQNKTLGEFIMDIANSKMCNYNGGYFNISQTDSPCNGDNGFDDTPPYHTYFWGTNECLNFNYVWYSGYMWRITEILNDGKVKMITENILSAINFGEDGFFENSYIKQWLNEDFLDTLYNHENILVEDATWDISPWYNWCYIKPPNTTKAPVGLMNPYEFNKTALFGSSSFLNLGHSWWLSSYFNLTPPPYTGVNGVNQFGGIAGWDVPNTAFGVRPVVVLKKDVKFSGEGTQTNPFVLLDDIEAAEVGDPINTRTPGELVQINDMLYRIVNIHKNEDGKFVTKLKSANYIKDDNGSVMKKQFGSMDFKYDVDAGVSETYDRIVKSNNDNYWLSYLNNEWLEKLEKQGIKKYLVEDTYYVNPAQLKPEDGSRIGSYKNTICKKTDTSETTKDCEKTTNTWTGYVGLPIVGELFAYPLGGTDTHDYKTATMTPYGDGNYPMIGVFETETQGIFQETYDNYFAVKPTITLRDDVIIESGDGKTPNTAFKIKLP